jgi:NAD(P)H-hydrate epimerase
MARLQPGAEVRTHRLETAEALAREKGVTVLLKGAGTVIAAPDGRSWVNPTGNPGMGTGGTGDVLSGLIGGLLAQGYGPGEAAAMGAFVHGRAGDELAQAHGQAAVRALDLAKALRVW